MQIVYLFCEWIFPIKCAAELLFALVPHIGCPTFARYWRSWSGRSSTAALLRLRHLRRQVMLSAQTARHLDDLHAVAVGIEDQCPSSEGLAARANGDFAKAAADFGDGLVHVVDVNADADAGGGTDLNLFALGVQAEDDVAGIELAPVVLLDEQLEAEHIAVKGDAALHVAHHNHHQAKFAEHLCEGLHRAGLSQAVLTECGQNTMHYPSPAEQRRQSGAGATSHICQKR